MTFEQIKSTSVGSGSPIYSIIFLFIHGRILFSIRVCGTNYMRKVEKPRQNVHQLSVGLHYQQLTSQSHSQTRLLSQ